VSPESGIQDQRWSGSQKTFYYGMLFSCLTCKVAQHWRSNRYRTNFRNQEGTVVASRSYTLATASDGLKGASQAVPEACLLSDAKRGHRGALGELCERYSKKILRTTLRITKNREDAEDALQDALLSAFVHIREFNARSSFYTWLTRIAINCSLMRLRKNRGCREVSIDEPIDIGEQRAQCEPADRAPGPEARCAQREEDAILRRAVRQLSPAVRQALEIRLLHESSIKETAEILGISVEATKGRLFHARAALRRASRLATIAPARVRKAA
jgi:RNA polymerase sigma factor (sigma-70 family)